MKKFSTCDCLLKGNQEIKYDGPLNAEIMFIGESPGRKELMFCAPFCQDGDSGALMNKLLRQAGLSRTGAFVANAARCLIDKAELSDREIKGILDACRPKLERAIRAVKPKVIVLLGGMALRQVTRKRKITDERGRWLWSEEFNAWIMPTFHPAYCVRDPSNEPILLEDLKLVAELKLRGFKHAKQQTDNRKWIEVQSIAPLLTNPPEIISADTETIGLDWATDPPIIICYSIGIKPGKAAVVHLFEECSLEESEFTVTVKRVPPGKVKPIPTEVGIRGCENFEQKLLEMIQLFGNQKILKIMQNGAFDVHFIENFIRYFAKRPNFRFRGFYLDTMSAAHVLDENLFTMAPLELLQMQLTDFRDDYWREFEQTYRKDDMIGVPWPDLAYYACGDADVTLRVGLELIKRLKEIPSLWRYYRQLTHPAITRVLIEMERNGVRIDREALPIVLKEIRQDIDKIHSKAIRLLPDGARQRHLAAKKKILLTRKDLIRDVLFAQDGWNINSDGLKKTKAKSVSVDKETRLLVLDKKIPRAARTFIELFEEWDTLHTLLTRYLGGFEKYIKSDGRIHTSYTLAKTVTGRSASKAPNMQNNPKHSKEAKRIRRLICAKPGYSLVAIDMSQSELRWIAHIANVTTMIKLFKEGADLHVDMAEAIKGKKASEMTPDELKEARQHAKAVNFGGIYGISPYGFQRNAKKSYKLNLTEEQAREYLSVLLDQKHPRLRAFHREIVAECRQKGYVESPFGRRRHLPTIKSTDEKVRKAAERQAINSTVQEASSSVVLSAAAEIARKKILDPKEAKLVAFVHDELVFEVKEGREQHYFRLIKRELENPPTDRFGFKLRLPLIADGKYGKNLAEMQVLLE